MAEFCLDCFNKYCVSEKNKICKEDAVFSEDLCEGCGKYTLCVVSIKRHNKKSSVSEKLHNIIEKIKKRTANNLR